MPCIDLPSYTGSVIIPSSSRADADRLLRCVRGHAVNRIGIVLDHDDIVVGDVLARLHQRRGVARDFEDLGLGFRRRAGRVDAVLGEARHHARLGRAGDGAHDDRVEREAKFPLLRPHLFGETEIAEPAVFVHRSAGRNCIGPKPSSTSRTSAPMMRLSWMLPARS